MKNSIDLFTIVNYLLIKSLITQTIKLMENNIKVIVLKSKNYKWFIGFSSNSIEWIKKWLSIRNQYKDLKEITSTHYEITYLTSDENNETSHFYITSIRDGEEFMVSLNDNCSGFNDFH